MLARPIKSTSSCQRRSPACSQLLAHRSCRMPRAAGVAAAGLAGTAVTAAAGPEHTFPNDVLAAVKHYDEHCKAAYIMYEQFKDNRGEDNAAAYLGGIKGHHVFEQADKGSTSTEGPLGPSPGLGWDANAPKYAIIKNMLGYSSRGNVFVKPTPDVPTAVGPVALAAPTMSLVGAAAAPAIGIVGKARAMMAGLFAAATRVIWKPITWLFKKTQPTYLGYIAEGPGGVEDFPELVIAFRGSSSYSDWIMNLLGGVAAKDVYGKGNGRVHQGFHNMAHDWPTNKLGLPACTEEVTPIKGIEDALTWYKEKYKCFPPKIVCTGHSLGGAIAILAAAHIAIQHKEEYNAATDGTAEPQAAGNYTERRLQVYTFAAPRVGDKDLSRYFGEMLGLTVVQVKNELDPTPYVAPAASEVSGVLRKLWGRTQLARWLNNEDGAAAAAAGVVFGTAVSSSTAPQHTAAAAGPAAAVAPGTPESALTAAQQPVDAAAEARHNKLRKKLDVYLDVANEFYASSPDDLGGLEWSAGTMQGTNQELADEFDDLVGLESSAKPIRGLAPAQLGRALSFFERMWYRQQLARTLETAWCDNPAPAFGCGIFSSNGSGKWGGAMHSLEVYLQNIKK